MKTSRSFPLLEKTTQLSILVFFLLQSSLSFGANLKDFEAKNWGLGKKAADVSGAWEITQGSKNVIVAVIDTGIDANHPELKPNLWHAPTTQGHVGNGSMYGWDFVTKSPNPTDINGHGTHIAGIIGGIANSKIGSAGVTQNVQIMAVRYYNESAPGKVNLENTIKALHFAIDNGAKIINYSGGGPEYSEAEFQAMKKAERKGVLIVAAAGNDHHDTDISINHYFPAAYKLKGLKNIITVASVDQNGKLLPSSNWGLKTVDVAAPGDAILSTIPSGLHGKMTGTSQATAFVSGIAALILSKQPSLSPEQIKKVILSNTDYLASLHGKIASSGKVNAHKAVLAIGTYNEAARNMASQNK